MGQEDKGGPGRVREGLGGSRRIQEGVVWLGGLRRLW